MALKIGGTTVKPPHSMPVEKYNLTKSGRVASGKMTMELVAKKRKLECKYNYITDTDMQTILNKINGTNMFFTVEWDDSGGAQSMTAYVGAIKGELRRKNKNGVWVWEDVEFALIEQ